MVGLPSPACRLVEGETYFLKGGRLADIGVLSRGDKTPLLVLVIFMYSTRTNQNKGESQKGVIMDVMEPMGEIASNIWQIG